MSNAGNLFAKTIENNAKKIYSFLTMKEIFEGMNVGRCIRKPLLRWGIPIIHVELIRFIKKKKLSLNQLISKNGKLLYNLEHEMKYYEHNDWVNVVSYYSLHKLLQKKQLDKAESKAKSTSYFNHSLMGDYGLEVLAYLLTYYKKITKILLEKTAIADSSKFLRPFLSHFKDLKYVTEINLSHNNIADIGAKCLFENLKKCTSPIKILNLNHNNISFQSGTIISHYLISNTTLTHFDLGYNILGPSGIGLIIGGIQSNTTLNYLELGYNAIRSEGCKYLLKALEYNQNITYIGLGGNYFHEQGFKYISKIISTNTNLERIDLQFNDCEKEALNFLSLALENNKSLQEIDLSGNKITFDMSINLFHNLHLCPSLTSLILKDNNMDYKTVYALLQGVMKNTHITLLDLSNNKLDDQCCKAMFEFLKFNKHIKELNISNCELRSNLHFIAEGLKINNSLTSFKVNDNQLSNEALIDLITALKFNYTVTQVHLTNNGIDDDIAKELSKLIISSQTKITYINLSNNDITQKGGNFLQEAIKLTPTLTGLNLANNKIGKDMQIAIDKSIAMTIDINNKSK